MQGQKSFPHMVFFRSLRSAVLVESRPFSGTAVPAAVCGPEPRRPMIDSEAANPSPAP